MKNTSIPNELINLNVDNTYSSPCTYKINRPPAIVKLMQLYCPPKNKIEPEVVHMSEESLIKAKELNKKYNQEYISHPPIQTI